MGAPKFMTLEKSVLLGYFTNTFLGLTFLFYVKNQTKSDWSTCVRDPYLSLEFLYSIYILPCGMQINFFLIKQLLYFASPTKTSKSRYTKFSKKITFLTPDTDTYVCVSGGKKY